MIQATVSYIAAAILIIGSMLYVAIVLNQHKEVAYDCQLASYPTAIDIPQEVIRKCRELK